MLDLQKELQELKAKFAELESRILFPNEPVAKWQPKGGEWFINQCDDAVEYWKISTEATKVAGLERQTEEQAERAAVEMRRFNRLLALRDELCGDKVVDWNDHKYKHYVYFSHSRAKWFPEFNDDYESINPYFTSRESAQKACDMLNSGEVEL